MSATTKTVVKYIEAVGRRKEAVVRVRLTPASKTTHIVNGKNLKDYFKLSSLIDLALRPLVIAKSPEHFTISIHARGGGIAAQADAVALGLARALVKTDHSLRTLLKKEKLLVVDARQKERRKFGLKKARKAPQWSKR
ncbi:MAG: 30S ribosomal protein S9 [bacterium]|nr:30S ribosomal protein S9 [bacterium]